MISGKNVTCWVTGEPLAWDGWIGHITKIPKRFGHKFFGQKSEKKKWAKEREKREFYGEYASEYTSSQERERERKR